jgi:hypothetical protein
MERWLTQLVSPEFAAREEATSRFLAIGEGARPFLERAVSSLDLEGRLRVRNILANLSVSRSDPKDLVRPTLVTLEAREEPIFDVVRRLGEQVGVVTRFGYARPDPADPTAVPAGGKFPITFEVRERPFFEAVDLLCAETSLGYYTDHMTGELVFTPTQQPVGPVCYVGPLRVMPTSLSVTHQTRFVDPPTTQAYLQLRCDIEPSAPVIGLVTPVRGARARDDRGRLIAFVEPVGQRRLQLLGAQRQVFQSLHLEPPDREARKIVGLEFPIEVAVPEQTLTATLVAVVVVPLDSPGEGPLELKVEGDVLQNGRRQITLSYRAPTPTGPSDLQGTVFWERIEVEDPRGQPIVMGPPPRRQRQGLELRTLDLPEGPVGRIRVQCLVRFAVERVKVVFPELDLP